jgi:hypothetical protein
MVQAKSHVSAEQSMHPKISNAAISRMAAAAIRLSGCARLIFAPYDGTFEMSLHDHGSFKHVHAAERERPITYWTAWQSPRPAGR